MADEKRVDILVAHDGRVVDVEVSKTHVELRCPQRNHQEDPEDGENSDSKNGDTASDGNDKIGETVNVSVREDNVAMESNREDDDEETSPSPSSSDSISPSSTSSRVLWSS